MAARKKTPSRVETRDKKKMYDAEYMGEEPEWDGVTFRNDSARRVAKIAAFNWYNYFRPEISAYRKDIKDWIKQSAKVNGSTVSSSVATKVESVQAAKLMAMSLRGWELSEEELLLIDGAIMKAVIESEKPAPIPEEASAPEQGLRFVSPPRLLIDLDDMEDRWMDGEPAEISIVARQEINKDTKVSLSSYAIPWVEGRLAEYTEEWEKEAYPDVTIKERNRRAKYLRGALKELNGLVADKRAVRKKRAPTVAAQAKGFVCLAESVVYKVKSVPLKGIIGAERVFLFNEKYRTLTELVALPGGFSGKGMAITNVDMTQSRTTTLRKPLDILPKVCKNALRTIHKTWNGLTTKDTEANPRLNRNTVIVRVM